jgi:hypothetical protein
MEEMQMKRLVILSGILAVAIFAVVSALQIAAQMARSQRCIQDPRWQAALAHYKAARERNAPQVELEQTKRELGLVFRQIRSEQAV